MERHTITMTIDGAEYVCIPRAEYDAALGEIARPMPDAEGLVAAQPYTVALIAEHLRAARRHAKLTQAQLAKKLRKSQTMVALTEAGKSKVGERYVRAVLKACGLPENWTNG